MKEYYARYKQTWSKPVDEDSVIIHLSEQEGGLLCGIDKRFVDVWNIGFGKIENIEDQAIHLCKKCYSKYKANKKI